MVWTTVRLSSTLEGLRSTSSVTNTECSRPAAILAYLHSQFFREARVAQQDSSGTSDISQMYYNSKSRKVPCMVVVVHVRVLVGPGSVKSTLGMPSMLGSMSTCPAGVDPEI